jgi:hypothetical protein
MAITCFFFRGGIRDLTKHLKVQNESSEEFQDQLDEIHGSMPQTNMTYSTHSDVVHFPNTLLSVSGEYAYHTEF